MKINFKVVLTGGLLGGALMLLPVAAKAQESGALQQFPALEQLDLTAEQEAQITQVRQDARTQLEGVLSAEQQQSVKTSMEQGATSREAIAPLDLSSEQRTQLRSIQQSIRQDIANILTPEQQHQVQQYRQSH
jgi:periplasmic protein CpxP/Spy